MKDKRLLLRIASIIEFIIATMSILIYIKESKNIEEMTANIFLAILDIIVAIILLLQSRKTLGYLKNNKLIVAFCSIWLFVESIIPGIFGFIFLNMIKDKKSKQLPIVEEVVDKKDIIMSISLFIMFILIMFILPMFNFFNKIPSIFVYAFIFTIVFAFNYKSISHHFIIFKNNIKQYLPFIIKRYFIMLGIMIIVSLPIVIFNGGAVSSNQQELNNQFKNFPLLVALLSCLYAPFVEELIFRMDISRIIKNKYIFIVLSGVLFGTLHMINKMSGISDILYIIQYSALGICLAKAYKDTNNIFVSISMHFIQNTLSTIVMLLLFLR